MELGVVGLVPSDVTGATLSFLEKEKATLSSVGRGHSSNALRRRFLGGVEKARIDRPLGPRHGLTSFPESSDATLRLFSWMKSQA